MLKGETATRLSRPEWARARRAPQGGYLSGSRRGTATCRRTPPPSAPGPWPTPCSTMRHSIDLPRSTRQRTASAPLWPKEFRWNRLLVFTPSRLSLNAVLTLSAHFRRGRGGTHGSNSNLPPVGASRRGTRPISDSMHLRRGQQTSRAAHLQPLRRRQPAPAGVELWLSGWAAGRAGAGRAGAGTTLLQ